MLSRTAIVWALGIPLTLVFFVLILASLAFGRGRDSVHSIGSVWFRLILRLAGVEVRSKGLQDLPSDRAFVIMSNHQGVFDIPVIQAHLPLQFRWVAKKSLFRIPVIGWAMRLAGYISIERERAGSAYRSMEEAAGLVASGTSVLIFPEGTRSRTGEMLDFKRGGFRLARNSNAWILPVSVTGTRDIMKGMTIRPARVTLTAGCPIDSAGKDEDELMEKTRLAIEAGVKEGAWPRD